MFFWVSNPDGFYFLLTFCAFNMFLLFKFQNQYVARVSKQKTLKCPVSDFTVSVAILSLKK